MNPLLAPIFYFMSLFFFLSSTSCSYYRCTEVVTPAEGAQVRFAECFKLVIIRNLLLLKIFFFPYLILERLF